MTTKRRSKKDGERRGPSPDAGSSVGADEKAPDKKVPEKKVSNKKVPDEKAGGLSELGVRKTLPAFGFAADLLKQRPAGSESEATSRVVPESAAGAAATPKPGSAPAARLRAASAAKPQPRKASGSRLDTEAEDRIFRFADSLEADRRDDETETVAQRLETCLTFTLATEIFAMPVKPVREVLRLSTITRVPHAPRPIRGVTNLRGRVLPVIDLRLRIELPETQVTRNSRIVVVNSRGRLLGLLVDAVHQVVHIDLNQVQAPPDDVMTFKSDYISGVYHMGEKLVLLLDVERSLIIREADPGGVAAAGPA